MTELAQRGILTKEREYRSVPFLDVELRSVAGTDDDLPGMRAGDLVFTGYASVTGRDNSYQIEDWAGTYTEWIARGAFKTALALNADVPFKLNHEGITLARTKSGTMKLTEDGTGLLTKASLDPASPVVQTIQSAMNRGDVDEMSFAFWALRQKWTDADGNDGGYDNREILEVKLDKGDVSVVNYGANPNTAGAKLRAKDVSSLLDRLSDDELREVYERLAIRLTPQPVGRSLLDVKQTLFNLSA